MEDNRSERTRFFVEWLLTLLNLLVAPSALRDCVNEILPLLGCYTAYIVIYTDVLGEPIWHSLKSQAVEDNLDSLTIENGTEKLYRHVGKEQRVSAA
jgi:hypothetical protein